MDTSPGMHVPPNRPMAKVRSSLRKGQGRGPKSPLRSLHTTTVSRRCSTPPLPHPSSVEAHECLSDAALRGGTHPSALVGNLTTLPAPLGAQPSRLRLQQQCGGHHADWRGGCCAWMPGSSSMRRLRRGPRTCPLGGKTEAAPTTIPAPPHHRARLHAAGCSSSTMPCGQRRPAPWASAPLQLAT